MICCMGCLWYYLLDYFSKMGREVKVHRQGGTCLRSSTLEAEAREHDLNLQTEGYPEKHRKKVLEHRFMRYPRACLHTHYCWLMCKKAFQKQLQRKQHGRLQNHVSCDGREKSPSVRGLVTDEG